MTRYFTIQFRQLAGANVDAGVLQAAILKSLGTHIKDLEVKEIAESESVDESYAALKKEGLVQ